MIYDKKTIFCLCIILCGFFIIYQPEPNRTFNESQLIIEQISRGGSGSNQNKNNDNLLIADIQMQDNFDQILLRDIQMQEDFHRRLHKLFPDWKERLEYEKNQYKFYQSAMKKKEELNKRKLNDQKLYYTQPELTAMDYFNGVGFYEKQQNPHVKPNIFDTRETFIRKMHDSIERERFLRSPKNFIKSPDFR